jgi:putative IMPACT (imprinted ancient) family translation regulator
LNVLQHKHIGDVVAVVIRYFGGIKLGAGGLVRAYGTATQQASEILTLVEQIPHQNVNIKCEYADEPTLRRWIESQNGILLDSEYSNIVVLKVSLPVSCVDDLHSLTAGWNGTEIDTEMDSNIGTK